MAQNNDHTIGFRKFEQRAADGLGAFAGGELAIRRGPGVVDDFGVGRVVVVGSRFIQGEFPASIDFSQFVITQIQGDAPEEGGELADRLIIFAPCKHAGESLLREVLAAVDIAKHAGAEALDGLFPSRDQVRESLGVVVHFDAPHGLLVRSHPVDFNHVVLKMKRRGLGFGSVVFVSGGQMVRTNPDKSGQKPTPPLGTLLIIKDFQPDTLKVS